MMLPEALRWTCPREFCKFQWLQSFIWFHYNFTFIFFLYNCRIAQVAQILIGIAILFTFGLQFFVPADILWREMAPRIPKEKHNMSQILFRTGLVLIEGGIAAAVPKLEPFIGLVGAIFFSILGKINFSLETLDSFYYIVLNFSSLRTFGSCRGRKHFPVSAKSWSLQLAADQEHYSRLFLNCGSNYRIIC